MALQGDIVKEYLERFPKVPNLTLARKIYKENKEVFNSIDSVRTRIRMFRGKLGKKNKENLTDKRFLDQKPKLPKSQTLHKATYQIPVCNNRILIIGDLHVPYHDEKAIKAAVKFGKSKRVNTVIINGDLIDFYFLSRWEKDPRKRNTAFEISQAKEVLRYIRAEFPKALIVYYLGNHDQRFNKYMLLKAPELLDIPEFDFGHIMGLRELNIILVDNNRGWKAGKLNGRHGHEFYGSGGVFPARAYYLKAKDNILVNHVHQSSEFTIPDIQKRIHGGFSVACLCDLDPDYNPNNSHNQGCAYLEIYKDGDFMIENKKIYNGKLL